MSKKLIQAAAGAGGEPVYVEDVFSTYLYEGNDTTQTVTTGLDIANEGGLIWQKPRVSDTYNNDHKLFDTERGQNKVIYTNNTSPEDSGRPLSYTSTGFTLDTSSKFYGLNENNKDYVTWNFVKQAGFFDVVTWTGDGTSNRQITHNLGSVPGCIIVKRLNSTADWAVWHRGFNSASTIGAGFLNLNTAFGNEALFSNNSSAFSDSYFLVSSSTNRETNGYLDTYVAYVFAHDDQSFGDDSDESIIKCGNYTGNGSTDGPTVTLGFEPQWIMIRGTGGSDWTIFDNMRGLAVGGNDSRLWANLTNAENNGYPFIDLQPTGFKLQGSTGGAANGSGSNYIYIAIRRPMKTPEAGTDVFAQDTRSSDSITTNFPVDAVIGKNNTATSDWFVFDRLRKTTPSSSVYLKTNSTAAELSVAAGIGIDSNTSIYNINSWSAGIYYNFKRATGFFDVVCFDGVNGATAFDHGLTVVPEMMIVKKRSATSDWTVYHTGYPTPTTNQGALNLTGGYYANASFSTIPTSTQFTFNAYSTGTQVAYLFATLAGVSKVGSYTGTGSALTVDCGFTSGARFIMIKRTDAAAGWIVFDSVRGIVAGADPYLYLNTTDAESSTDAIDPDSSGFIVNPVGGALNTSGGEYIFLAIA